MHTVKGQQRRGEGRSRGGSEEPFGKHVHDGNTRYIGLVSTDEEAVFNEFVVLQTDGTSILPVNAGDYPETGEHGCFPAGKRQER